MSIKIRVPDVQSLTVKTSLQPSTVDVREENIVQTVKVPGTQGPPGVQNVHVGITPPENPFENMIWIDTSETQ